MQYQACAGPFSNMSARLPTMRAPRRNGQVTLPPSTGRTPEGFLHRCAFASPLAFQHLPWIALAAAERAEPAPAYYLHEDLVSSYSLQDKSVKQDGREDRVHKSEESSTRDQTL